MWPVLVFLFVVICWTLYHWNHEYNRRKNRTKMAKNDWYMQSDTTENTTFPKAAIFDTPPNPEEVEIASNPSTDPEILAKLGKTHQRRSIRRYVASNPNTPVPILWQLAKEFPQQVADNTMMLLLQLENPKFVLEMPYQYLVEILHTKDAPELFINGGIGHHMSMVIVALLKNPKLSSAQLEQLIDQVESDEMVHLFLSHQNCHDSTKIAITKGDNPLLQIGLAKRCLQHQTEYSIFLLETLIEHGSLKVQGAIACNVTISDAWLDRLLTPDRKELQQTIAESGYRYVLNWHTHSPKKLSDRLQLRLAQNQLNDLAYRISVRQILAENKVNPDILELLSRDPYTKVRASVAKRSDLPQEILLRLAEDQAEAVQHSLIKNKSIDADRLTIMAQTPYPRMRELAAQHPNTPIPILEMLVADSLLAEHIARNPNTPAATLQKIADAGTQNIALTQNPQIADAIVQPILAKLAIDPSYTIRKLVARHPQTPRLILTQLAQDPEPKVQRLAQKRLTSD
jgi:hypothetical protein